MPNNYLWPCLVRLVFIITAASPELVEDPPPVAGLNINFLVSTPSSKELMCPADWSKTVDGENTENIVYELSALYESVGLPSFPIFHTHSTLAVEPLSVTVAAWLGSPESNAEKLISFSAG